MEDQDSSPPPPTEISLSPQRLEASSSSSPLPISIGTRIQVYWDGKSRYFAGTVTDQQRGRVFIEYDDGDAEWLDPTNERVQLMYSNAVSNEEFWREDFTVPANLHDDWMPETKPRAEDSDTDDEELHWWAHQMLGAPPPSISISEAVKLKQRRKTTNSYRPKETILTNSNKPTRKKPRLGLSQRKNTTTPTTTNSQSSTALPQRAESLTIEQIRQILGEDPMLCSEAETHWVRRSVRQPSRSALTSPNVQALLHKLRNNDPDMVVLKMKKYVNDSAAPQIVMDAVLDALQENSNCQALYIQNFNEGMRDAQVIRLVQILAQPTCQIWCLNIGETYKVQTKTWKVFAKGLKDTNITHMYASEHTLTPQLKDDIRNTIRNNRSKHNRHMDPNNLNVIVQCTHCWWNPINAKVLRPYLRKHGYEYLLHDKEAQGARGSTSVVPTK